MKSKIPEKVKSIRFLIKRPPVRLDNCGKVTKIVCFGIELVYVVSYASALVVLFLALILAFRLLANSN